MSPVHSNMPAGWSVGLIAGFMLLVATATHCVETNEYPNTRYRNAEDLQFQVAASYDNFDEMNTGTLAAANGSNPAVRVYGQMIVNDRSAAESDLKKITDSVNAAIPQGPEAGDEDRLLSGLSGMAFDTSYLREEILDHDSAIGLYRGEVSNGSYVSLVQYAANHLPLLQMRRTTADSLLRALQHP